MKIRVENKVNNIPRHDWNSLISTNSPFEQQAFYQALENSGSVSSDTGWQAQYFCINHHKHLEIPPANTNVQRCPEQADESLTAIIPTYLKNHSWGEYIFDWDWAQAYERNGLDYYPKLVATIPFTPVPSHKVLLKNKLSLSSEENDESSSAIAVTDVFSIFSQYCQQEKIHSWHWLFCQKQPGKPFHQQSLQAVNEETENLTENSSEYISQHDLPDDIHLRYSVQFHWFNLCEATHPSGYESFEHYLSFFTARKRKNTKKERASISQQGISIKQLQGAEITEEALSFFYLCYQLTYLKRNHQPHLSRSFFSEIVRTMPENILLVLAYKNEEPIAAAFFFFDDTHLYGRYWGATEQVNNLHFELCYYQGIDFCIKHKLKCFNPGTQGEHKIQRGFQPVILHSYHWLKAPYFTDAIRDFCTRERDHIVTYVKQCQQALPFKQAD